MPNYFNEYKCPNCEIEWEDNWDSGCDDECPKCGTPITPHTSTPVLPMDTCQHLKVSRWFFEDGSPTTLWTCSLCGQRFEPVSQPRDEKNECSDNNVRPSI